MGKGKNAILIVLIAGIGDLVLASKSIRAIRKGFPDLDIHLLTSTEAYPIAQNYDFQDHVWAFPIRELRKDKSHILGIKKLVSNLRKMHFKMVINLYNIGSWFGSFKMGLFFSLLKAEEKIGHNHKGFGFFIDKRVPARTFHNRHVAEAMLDIAILAGGVPDDEGIEVFWHKASERKWEYLFADELQGREKHIRIGINPGGDRANRRWNLDYYSVVADGLVEHFDAKIIVLGGPGEENIASYIKNRMKNDATSLAGELTLNDLVYIISKFDLLITNDSGPMHIAAAVKTPLVAIFGPENPELFHPYTSPDKYIVIHKDLDCQPCSKRKCDHLSCLNNIAVSEVLEAAELLLSNRVGRKE